jgi:hypothetical protein
MQRSGPASSAASRAAPAWGQHGVAAFARQDLHQARADAVAEVPDQQQRLALAGLEAQAIEGFFGLFERHAVRHHKEGVAADSAAGIISAWAVVQAQREVAQDLKRIDLGASLAALTGLGPFLEPICGRNARFTPLSFTSCGRDAQHRPGSWSHAHRLGRWRRGPDGAAAAAQPP